MEKMTIEEMMERQIVLQEKYREKWGGLYPEKAIMMMLWMMAEAGEAAQIIKKKGSDAILEAGEVRDDFVEEMCDVLMYFNDVLLCFGITPEEFAEIYRKKNERNMNRW